MPASVRPRCSGVIALRGQRAVDVDQVLHAADLGAEDDLVVREAVTLGGSGRFDGARHDGVQRDFAGVLGLGQRGVLVHHAGEQRRIERAPVHADAHRLVVLDGHFDHGAEIVVGLAADIDVAGIDAVLGQRARAFRILLEQDVAVVVEVADDGHADAELVERVDDLRHGGGGLLGVHGDAHQFGAGARQRHHLVDGGRHVGRIGVGHRLHDDRMIAADLDTSDVHHYRLAAGFYSHRFLPAIAPPWEL